MKFLLIIFFLFTQAYSQELLLNKLSLLSGEDITLGNNIELLINKEIHDTKFEMLKNSKIFFWASVFIVRCDKETMPFFYEMKKKHIEGVDVRLLVDWAGNFIDTSRCVQILKSMGLDIRVVKTSRKTLLSELTHDFGERGSVAFHPKFWISDNREAIVDGVNIMNIHIRSTDSNGMYKDLGVHINGPTVTTLSRKFIQYWKKYTNTNLAISHFKKINEAYKAQLKNLKRVKVVSENHKGMCVFLDQNPLENQFHASQGLIEQLKAARNSITMTPLEAEFNNKVKYDSYYKQFYQTFYDINDEKQISINLLLNNKGTWSFYEENPEQDYYNHGQGFWGEMITKKYKKYLAEEGLEKMSSHVDFFRDHNPNFQARYSHQFNHSKVLVTDNNFFSIGSHNMNDRSFISDIEAMLFCFEPNVAAQISNKVIFDIFNGEKIGN
ncbi:MAG: phosphatidylserine/phosphatidylglycerophosphate/cardiolipin synthase family protein [Halobacteriovoraceae bacterium]|nr:phosphatidylserine/phosphatidylglycerophosphate/cardiolipin synthase family protein [Halobacteriovoraceae bacterium]MCB9094101.1 phosphatidylserine/phosphatidylglycerophosphate/cardiolipin synthase family protein [Halobacteriovoraceae bacterium]